MIDPNKKIREQVSALADGELALGDGELPAPELELAFAALRTPEGQQAWKVYHRIGDVLRAEASADLSPGFNERLAARLAKEHPHGRRAATEAEAQPAMAVSPSAPAA